MAPKLTPKYELTIDGSPAPAEVVQSLISITVRLDAELSDAIEVRLRNEDLEWSDGDTLAEGTKVSVKLGYVESDAFDTLASGTVVRRECEFPERGGSTITVVAYDSKQQLKQGKKSKTWTNVKHSDVVSQLCQANGLEAEVDDTQDTVPYLFQIAQTDLAFIRQLASFNGFEVHVDEKGTKLSFKKPTTGDSSDATLTWGEDLLSFRPRFSIHGQLQATTVRGWDPAQKQAVVGKATTSDLQSAMSSLHVGADLAKQDLGERDHGITTRPATSTDEATAMARAAINSAMQNFAEAEGSCQGNPKLSPGCVLDIENVGARASGSYYVTSALHCFEPRGFTTYFRLKRPGSGTPPTPPPAQPGPPPPPDAGEDPGHAHLAVRPRTAAGAGGQGAS